MRMDRRAMTVGLATVGLLAVTGGGVAWAVAAPGAPGGSGPAAGQCAGPRAGEGPFGEAAGENSPMTAAADYLGLTWTELVEELRSGSSLAEIAQDRGKSVAGLEDALLSAMERNLDAHTDLTDAQRDAALAAMASRVDAMIDGTYPYGMGPGHMGGGMMGGGMMGGGARGWMGGFGA